MMMKKILMLATVVLLLALGAGTALAQSGYDLFQKALVKERAVGDVEEALRLYQQIVKEFAGNHALAAKAELRMGLLYDRLGRKADAQRAYQAVVSQYADQTNEARQARAKIVVAAPRKNGASAKVMTGSTARRTTMIWADVDQQETWVNSPSADGRYLAFTDGRTGDLAVRDLREDTNRYLTNKKDWAPSGEEADEPIVSPDGRQVAYTWERHSDKDIRKRIGYDLRIRSLNGAEVGEPQIVHQSDETRYIKTFGWTLDGKSLLVVRQLQDRANQIALISIADGSVRVLKSLELRWPIKVSLSPDGRYIAYDAPAGADVPARDIFLLTADGSHETVVVQNPANDHQPVWSPDGSQILFVSDRTGKNALWTVHIDAGTPRGPAELVRPDIGRLLAITRSGALYYVSGGDTRNIYTVDVDANMKVKTAPSLATDRFVNSNFNPVLSPDGQHLAYYSDRTGSRVLVIRSLKTGEEREVPGRLLWGGRVRWFPDSRSVFVPLRDLQSDRTKYYRVDTVSGSAELLLDVKQTLSSDLSPDGKSIYYIGYRNVETSLIISDQQAQLLIRFDIDSRRETEVKSAPEGSYFTSLAISPDGAQLAYLLSTPVPSSLLPFRNQLGVVPVSGGQSRDVFLDDTVKIAGKMLRMEGSDNRFNSVAWTPDQRYLLFVMQGNAHEAGNRQVKHAAELWRVPVTGGDPEPTGVSVKGGLYYPGMSPDGRQITFGAEEPHPDELWALENFLPATQTKKTTASRR
jgi:Tol biopolymer transport system component